MRAGGPPEDQPGLSALAVEVAALRAGLTDLRDRQLIQATIYTHARGIDRLDERAYLSVFWPDVRFPDGPHRGHPADFVPHLIRERAPSILAGTQHFIGNIIIDLRGEDAFVETYAVAHHLTYANADSNAAILGVHGLEQAKSSSNEQNILVIGLRYFDHFQKRQEDWKILQRQLIFDWSHAGTYDGIAEGGLYQGTPLRGLRNPRDPTYTRGDHNAGARPPKRP